MLSSFEELSFLLANSAETVFQDEGYETAVDDLN